MAIRDLLLALEEGVEQRFEPHIWRLITVY